MNNIYHRLLEFYIISHKTQDRRQEKTMNSHYWQTSSVRKKKGMAEQSSSKYGNGKGFPVWVNCQLSKNLLNVSHNLIFFNAANK